MEKSFWAFGMVLPVAPLGLRFMGFRRFYTPSAPLGLLEAGKIAIALAIRSLDRGKSICKLIKTAFSAFSPACWASQQAWRGMACDSANKDSAVLKSSSA